VRAGRLGGRTGGLPPGGGGNVYTESSDDLLVETTEAPAFVPRNAGVAAGRSRLCSGFIPALARVHGAVIALEVIALEQVTGAVASSSLGAGARPSPSPDGRIRVRAGFLGTGNRGARCVGMLVVHADPPFRSILFRRRIIARVPDTHNSE